MTLWADVTSQLPVNLILTSATAGNVFSISGFYVFLSDRNYADFNLVYRPYDTTHAEVYELSFRAGLDLLFP